MKKVLVIVISTFILFAGCSKLGLGDKTNNTDVKNNENKNLEYVVFASNGNNNGIYSVDSTGKGSIEVLKDTYDKARGLENKIIFYSEIDGKKGIYSSNADGTDKKLLLEKYVLKDVPAISPDLNSFIFLGRRTKESESTSTVYYMKLGEESPLKLIGIKSYPRNVKYISFLNNNTIVYSKKVYDKGRNINKIYKYTLSENKEEVLLESKSNCVNPVFSPDKSKMAFLSDKGRNYNLYVYNLETKEETLMDSKTIVFGGSVKWSPDGNSIICKVLEVGEKNKIKIIDTHKKSVKEIGDGYIADFSKDGKYIVYASYDSENKKQTISKYLLNEGKSNTILEFSEPVNKAESINMLYCTNKVGI